MSAQNRTPSVSGSKRAASPTNAATEMPAQRMRLSEAAAANPLAAVRPRLSPAQRCAADALTLVFGFIEMKELVHAALTCREWYSAAAKDQPRGLSLELEQADQLADLCTSSSPFKTHISRIVFGRRSSSLSFVQLAQLCYLPELAALEVRLNAAGLTRMILEDGWRSALAELQAAFPPTLRELTLVLSTSDHSPASCQLLMEALPVMQQLEGLSLMTSLSAGETADLTLDPLLHLPHLTHLTLDICDLTEEHLWFIKQISTLRYFDSAGGWTADQLSALCRPAHRLQQLQELILRDTVVDETVMAELVCLPSLTSLEPEFLDADAFAFLPRLAHLQRIRVQLRRGSEAAQQAERSARLVSALSACPALADLILTSGECTESFGSQLMQAVPRLRSLAFEDCSLPSLRFLRHAQNLKKLCLLGCRDVRVGHVIGIGAFAAQLECLTVRCCAALRLDEAEQRLLTPPGAFGLPHLLEFNYHSSPDQPDPEAGFLNPDLG